MNGERDEREPRMWLRALPWLTIPAVVIPFCVWFLPDWWQRISTYGWYRWPIVAWAAAVTIWAALYVAGPAIETWWITWRYWRGRSARDR